MAEKKTVSAKAVVSDIKAGMTDEQLMTKYQLSARGLQSLKNKLLAAGLITEAKLDGPTPASTENTKSNQVQVETGRNTQASTPVPENPDGALSPIGEGSATAQRGFPAVLAVCAFVAWIIQAFYVHKRFWFVVWDLAFAVLTLAAAASFESEYGQGEAIGNANEQEGSSGSTAYKVAVGIWILGSYVAWEFWTNRVLQGIFGR